MHAAQVTALLEAVQGGDRDALAALFPLIYDELSLLAHRQRQAWHGDLTLNTTAVVHEVYLKLVHQKRLPAESRAHFFAVAATAMRHILCNYARDRRAQKRGGDAPHVTLEPGLDVASQLDLSDEQTDELTALDEALHRLEEIADRQARIVECRFFGGMSVEDTASALGISPRTVKRDWNFARAWLRREMLSMTHVT
jgi:RNA polymerase sigma factor (TIGR02999 family)